MRRKLFLLIGVLALAVTAFVVFAPQPHRGVTLRIVSGSENAALEHMVHDWGRKAGVTTEMTYLGSVDIARELENGASSAYDAVWPANSLWIALGDSDRVVKHDASILRSPVVLGLKRSIAERLGWVGRDDITIQEIQQAAREGRFRLAMTSATQSNSGASAYFGFLYALAGNPDLLTLGDLDNEGVRAGVADLLAQVDRSSGSSGWLKDTLVENPDAFDAMFNYEALIIEANQILLRAGQEPLYAIYPANGLAVADSPLGYIDKGDADREAAFVDLQAHLQGEEAQAELVSLGRRAGLLGLAAGEADTDVWNPDWGIDLNRQIAPIPTPEAAVIEAALALYQTDLRKPSFTIWVLDTSGSMQGPPLQQLKSAMTLLLDPESSAVSLLQPSRRDVTVVVPFEAQVGTISRVEGNAPEDLGRMLSEIRALEAGGGTDLYRALVESLRQIEEVHAAGALDAYLPAIVAMTDGASDPVNREAFLRYLSESPIGRDVPIHAIAFGDADEAQLEELNERTLGRLFHAGDDLAAALRKAKGYN